MICNSDDNNHQGCRQCCDLGDPVQTPQAPPRWCDHFRGAPGDDEGDDDGDGDDDDDGDDEVEDEEDDRKGQILWKIVRKKILEV